MKTYRIPELFIKVIFELMRWECQMSEIRLIKDKHNEIDEPYDSPNYRRLRMLREVRDYLDRLLTNSKERRNGSSQEVFSWYDRRER